jgi:hypothetical protein
METPNSEKLAMQSLAIEVGASKHNFNPASALASQSTITK